MRAFACPVCGTFTPFELDRCLNCQAGVGLHLPSKSMVAVTDGAAMVDGRRWVRCTQAASLGCNWLTPAEQSADDLYQRGRCVADALIRHEPASDDTLAREKLVPTTLALRRLVYQLSDIGLPIEPWWRSDGGPAFDLLSSYTTGEKVIIGHANGVITIDLVETLDAYREQLRVTLGEPYRTMLGHFRHEVGHYYQNVLVENGAGALRYLAQCRELFGDETSSYSDGIARHYKFGAPQNWQASFISEYATMHPWGGLRRMLRALPAHHRHHRHLPGSRHGAAGRPGAVRQSARHRGAGVLCRGARRAVTVRLEVVVAVLQSGQHRHGEEPVVSVRVAAAGDRQARICTPRDPGDGARYGVMMLNDGSGLSSTATNCCSACGLPPISSPGEVKSPAANARMRTLVANVSVAAAVVASAATLRYTSTPLRRVSR
jgi:hypothetical protein